MKSLLKTDACPHCGYYFCFGHPDPDITTSEDYRYKRYEDDRDTAKRVAEAIGVITDALNRGQDEIVANAIAQKLTATHRTLQQKFMGVVIPAVIDMFAWMKKENRFDLRNEASCEVAEKLKKITDEEYFPHY